jgi:hypothetical protein
MAVGERCVELGQVRRVHAVRRLTLYVSTYVSLGTRAAPTADVAVVESFAVRSDAIAIRDSRVRRARKDVS